MPFIIVSIASGFWGGCFFPKSLPSQINNAPDPDAERERIEKRLEALNSPFRAGESMWYDEMIDPRETRPLLCEFVRQAYEVTKTQLGPKYRTLRP